MPAAISGTETVGMPPPSVADVFIQRNFHTIRSLLGYDTSYGIRYINLYHIPLLLQRMLEPFKTGSGSRGKESEGFRTTQLRVIILPILKHVSPTESESFDSSNSPPDMKNKNGEKLLPPPVQAPHGLLFLPLRRAQHLHTPLPHRVRTMR